MTDQPITPPPELRRLWAQQAQRTIPCHDPLEWMQYVSEKAAQWGADTELEACIAWFDKHIPGYELVADKLRAARRPKPPSLKEQALIVLYDADLDAVHENIIRRALEALPDD